MITVNCPICRTSASWQDNPWRPFCSERCQGIDLGSWVDGSYCLPGPESAPMDDFSLNEDSEKSD
jgi:endogenous inhibitor of DNA gyrase (YacG/DUF329 family)